MPFGRAIDFNPARFGQLRSACRQIRTDRSGCAIAQCIGRESVLFCRPCDSV